MDLASEAFLPQMDNSLYGKMSKIILDFFFRFIDQAEQTGRRKVDDWINVQNGSGDNAITQLLIWTRVLAVKPVLYFCQEIIFN